MFINNTLIMIIEIKILIDHLIKSINCACKPLTDDYGFRKYTSAANVEVRPFVCGLKNKEK